MVNIQAIEKSIMTADEKTLKEMAGNINVVVYGQLSPEARKRLAGQTYPTVHPPPFGAEYPYPRAATDAEIKSPHSLQWQKQSEKKYQSDFEKLRGNISEMSIDEIIDQKNLLIKMKMILDRVGALKGIV